MRPFLCLPGWHHAGCGLVRRASRRWAVCGWLAGSACLSQALALPVHGLAGQHDSSAIASMLPELPGFQWQAPSSLRLLGVQLRWQAFRSVLPLEEATGMLARHLPQLRRLPVPGARVLLAGTSASHHWLAQLHGGQDGSSGLLSVLPLHADAGQPPPWLASCGLTGLGDTLHLLTHWEPGHASEGEGVAIYASGLEASLLLRSAAETLRRSGWLPAAWTPALPRMATWQRGRRLLTLHAVAPRTGRGSSLLAHCSFARRGGAGG